MTTDDLAVLSGFLVSGLLAGLVGHWIDLVTAYARKG